MRNLFCGWIDAGATTVDPIQVLSGMVARTGATARASDLRVTDGPIGFWARCELGCSLADERYLVALWGDAHWAERAHLGASTPAEALLQRYLDRGPELLESQAGPCAFAIIDRQARTAVLAIDRLGSFSISHAVSRDGGLVFASSATALQGHPAVTSRVDRQACLCRGGVVRDVVG